MSVSRTLLLPAVLTASIVVAQSASASLVSIQEFESFGLSSINGESALSRVLAIASGDGGISTQVNSVFDQESGQIYFRLMRLIDGAGGGGGNFGGLSSGGDSDGGLAGIGSAEARIQGLFDLLEIGGFHQYVSNLESSYTVDFAKPGVSTSIPYIFSTPGSTYDYLPSVGSGFSPVDSTSSFSSDSGSSASYAAISYSAPSSRSYAAPAAASYGSFSDSVGAGPSASAATASVQQVEAAAPVVVQSAPAPSNDSITPVESSSPEPVLIATVVPEPTTSVMALCALGILGLRRRRA